MSSVSVPIILSNPYPHLKASIFELTIGWNGLIDYERFDDSDPERKEVLILLWHIQLGTWQKKWYLQNRFILCNLQRKRLTTKVTKDSQKQFEFTRKNT